MESKIKIFRSDGGGEFTISSFKHLFSSNGIVHDQLLCPHIPKQNGVETQHRHIVETGLSLLEHSFLPQKIPV